MRLLLDACVWAGDRQRFQISGHDAVWVTDWKEDPGDEVILRRAINEKRVMVTLDKDFGALAVLGAIQPLRHPSTC